MLRKMERSATLKYADSGIRHCACEHSNCEQRGIHIAGDCTGNEDIQTTMQTWICKECSYVFDAEYLEIISDDNVADINQLEDIADRIIQLSNKFEQQGSLVASQSLFGALQNIHQAIGALRWEDQYNQRTTK